MGMAEWSKQKIWMFINVWGEHVNKLLPLTDNSGDGGGGGGDDEDEGEGKKNTWITLQNLMLLFV